MQPTFLRFLGIALLTGMLQGAPQAGSRPDSRRLDGEWELIAAPGATRHRREIKIIADNHFVWVIYDLKNRTPVTIGGGICSLAGNQYTEQLEFGDIRLRALLDRPQRFQVETDGTTWRHTGVLSDGSRVQEIWKRVE